MKQFSLDPWPTPIDEEANIRWKRLIDPDAGPLRIELESDLNNIIISFEKYFFYNVYLDPIVRMRFDYDGSNVIYELKNIDSDDGVYGVLEMVAPYVSVYVIVVPDACIEMAVWGEPQISFAPL